MKTVIKTAIAASTAAAALSFATPASAAQIVSCNGAGCVQTDENVLLTTATNTALGLGETNQTGAPVQFTSSTDLLNLDAQGQATVSAVDQILNSLTFSLQNGFGFQTAEFNLVNGTETPLTVTILTSTGATRSFDLGQVNGSNWFAITADAGESITSATFNVTPGGFDSFRQLRLGGVAAAVPEPGTWALMLLGFGAVGVSMRRRRRSSAMLQMA